MNWCKLGSCSRLACGPNSICSWIEWHDIVQGHGRRSEAVIDLRAFASVLVLLKAAIALSFRRSGSFSEDLPQSVLSCLVFNAASPTSTHGLTCNGQTRVYPGHRLRSKCNLYVSKQLSRLKVSVTRRHQRVRAMRRRQADDSR